MKTWASYFEIKNGLEYKPKEDKKTWLNKVTTKVSNIDFDKMFKKNNNK